MSTKNNSKSGALKAAPPFIYRKIHKRFVEESVSNKLKFSQARQILGSEHRIPKQDSFEVLKDMQNFGLVEIEPYHFLRIKRWWIYG